MVSRQLVPPLLVALGVAAALIGVVLLPTGPAVRALPAAGIDILNVSAEVSVISRLGQETISLIGTATIQREDPRLEGGVEVVDAEIVSLSLAGDSVTGPITVSESATFTSSGEIRSLQPPPDQFPASSFFDVFVDAEIPVFGFRSSPTVHNEEPLHLVPASDLNAWPPVGVTYEAQIESAPTPTPTPGPCVPLLPSLPAEFCLTSVTILFGEPKTPTPTFTPCPPEVCTPTPTGTPPPTSTPTPTATAPPSEGPTYSVAAGGPSDVHPAELLGLSAPAPATVSFSDNDDFAAAWEITSLPFVGLGNTAAATLESGEPRSCSLMDTTVWFRFTPRQSATVQADTFGSNFDTVLAIHTGDSLGTLSTVTCNDDAEPFGPSRVTFAATGGTTYHLQVGGFSGSTGDVTLNVSPVTSPAGQAPFVRVPCASLGLTTDGCDDGSDGDQDDVDALSFGADFTAGDAPIAFSVAPGSGGLPDTAVAVQATCSPAQPQADEFSSPLDGTNALVFDGDGLDGDCPTATTLGLLEQPASDDLDALNEQATFVIDSDGDGAPDEAVFVSLAAGSPSLTAPQRSAADILWTVGGFQPGVYASASALGLQPEDDIDALCLADEGAGSPAYDSAVDTVLFSLAPGSPTLSTLGASPADVLVPGPEVRYAAADLGLQDGDDLNALTCFSESAPPMPTATPTITPGGPTLTPEPTATPTSTATSTPTPTPRGLPGDVSCDGAVNSIDAALILQFDAGLIGSLDCQQNADANGDDAINSIDAALILQFDAGLIPSLGPPATPTPTDTPVPPTATALPTPTDTPVPPTATTTSTGNCDPAYPTVCIPPPPPDLNCADIPDRDFVVLPPDPHGFDTDGDGLGCES